MVGGLGNTISGGYSGTSCCNSSFIGGGLFNQVFSEVSSVVGGLANAISNADFSVIAGGQGNYINNSCRIFIGGGLAHYVNNSLNSSIGGGSYNSIFGNYSFVGGGASNSVSGCYSAVLGGSGNTVSGNYSGAFGCNLNASAACTMYFNNVCVCGTLSKVSGSFKIPHPDPIKSEQGKFLKHSFVESPTAGDNIYRFNVTAINCSASIQLPDYYSLLNSNDQVFVNAKSHLGYGFGVVNEAQTEIDITTNSDGEYNVLLIGTRKDKLALDAWNGTEVNDVE